MTDCTLADISGPGAFVVVFCTLGVCWVLVTFFKAMADP